ncbi:FMRFamide receptor-like [Mizuhopecten yessoensis]|uniref:FMRFamide receptor n=1 Tax=Mizuhopecten yessoensis TaxID=6573 RepID=A0A210QH61_MIZYE|nr:FMRFamide receptor-like [Mizuhopecten yessoensis]XP_021358324.1 FMRFamide receptor-like [Mizuhopecten yessoensis]XP_021358325.1 FMRFamide receptor-like [Mizuhopecten yessoensis]OWF48057.1 FMRFamide receptor [Mizuhopecten yessoensis]
MTNIVDTMAMSNGSTTMANDAASIYFNNNTTTGMDIFNLTMASNITDLSNGTAIVASAADLKWAKVIYTYLGPSICAFGILCNVLNLIVLMQHQLKESPYTYLTGLAFTDLGALLLSFLYMVFSHKNQGVYFWRFFEAHIFLPFVNICTNSSVWIVVLLTIERFLFVRHPLWAKATCDRTSAKVKIVCIILLILALNIPRFLVFKVSYTANGTPFLDSTVFRKSDTFHAINWVYALVINFIPLVILSTANIYLVVAVKRASIQREVLQIRNNKEAAWQREQMRLTITLISIVFLFIICIIPSAFADFPIAYALFGEGYTQAAFRQLAAYRITGYISNLLVWCNLSINFVLYCAFNNKFRRVMCWTFKNIFHFHRKDGSFLLLVNFKNGHSITRNNSSQTNSMSMQTKVSSLSPDALLRLEKSDSKKNSIAATLYEKPEPLSDKDEDNENE